jgi:ACS family glucarate transporter-like MFS transporter
VLIFWMFVISVIAYLDRVNISTAGQFIQKELNLTNTQLGWMFSAFVLAYALTQAPGRPLILLAVRFTLGLGEAVVYPAGNRLVASCIPSGERGIANAVIFGGVGVGAGAAPPLITLHPAASRVAVVVLD